MSIGDRAGIAGLIMAFIGIALPLLFPDKKWIGWVCFGVGALLGIAWLVFELKNALGGTRASLVLTICGGALIGAITSGIIWSSIPHSSAITPARPVVALVLNALYVGIRNMPERAGVPTWNDKPWDEDDYADVRLTITNALNLPLQNLDLDISVTEGDPKAGIAGIAQLTNVTGVEFRKPPFQVPEPALRLKGDDGKSYNLPILGLSFLEEHRIVSDYRMFCPRLGQKDIIRLILATIHVGDHNRPPERLKITGTYVTESTEGRINGQVSEIIATTR
ncbi:MAG: hypothetical protein ABSG41_27800 [Bryobacteraceae bacterium]|jgi:hypothetical protein